MTDDKVVTRKIKLTFPPDTPLEEIVAAYDELALLMIEHGVEPRMVVRDE